MKKILFILLVCIATVGFAQVNSDQSITRLAMEYYRLKDYEKAAPLLLQLYEENGFASYFTYYVNCLIGLQQYDDAAKVVKKQLRKANSPDLQVTYGFIIKEQGNYEKAIKIYDEIIEDLEPRLNIVIATANAFLARGELNYAELTYLQAQKIMKSTSFYSYLATIYSYQRNYVEMMNQYFLMLREDERKFAQVQSRLTILLRNDFDNTLRKTIKNEIFKRIQAEPDNLTISRLLIWLYVAEKNYEKALAQSISLDKRTRQEENNILNFVNGASDNGLYEVALRGIKYLLSRTPAPANFDLVNMTNVAVHYAQFQNRPESERINAKELNRLFQNLFERYGYNLATFQSILDYAHFLAFSQRNFEKAKEILTEAQKIRGLSNNRRIEVQTLEADILLYDNSIWEAAFLYSQIIERNPNNSLIDGIKFKKALASYYSGNILWAKGNLDVLKASTSKLIANDAMQLSVIITDNYEMDTIARPLQLFAKADYLVYQNQDSLALAVLDTIDTDYPNHNLMDDIVMRRAKIAVKQFDYLKAEKYYKQLIEEISYSSLVDDALFKLAMLYETNLDKTDKAKELYKELLINHSGSIYAAEARKHFRNLRGDLVQ